MKNDIRLAIGFHRHLKVRKLLEILGAEGVLSLIILWTYAAANRTSGILHGLDIPDIAAAAEWKGSPRKFVGTLTRLGLLDKNPDGILEIHDWKHHQTWIFFSDARSERARGAASARWRPAPPKEIPDARRMRSACGVQCPISFSFSNSYSFSPGRGGGTPSGPPRAALFAFRRTAKNRRAAFGLGGPGRVV